MKEIYTINKIAQQTSGQAHEQEAYTPKWVNVVEIERRYGGPEEGGWYYTASQTILDSRKVLSKEEEKATAKEFEQEYEIKRYRGNTYLAIRITNNKMKSETFSRPSYE